MEGKSETIPLLPSQEYSTEEYRMRCLEMAERVCKSNNSDMILEVAKKLYSFLEPVYVNPNPVVS